jgi:FkbM family methyltransferase
LTSDKDASSGWDGHLLDIRKLFAAGPRQRWEADCRRLAFNARLAGDDVLCRVLGRYTFVVDASDVGLAPHLIADGFWEIWVTRLIASRIREGMVCFDAGANVGYYAVLMADLAGETGRLFAAEPVPPTVRLLTRNLHHNGFGSRSEVLPIALGAKSGRATMIMPKGEPKNALIGKVQDAEVESGEFARFDTPLAAIDDLDIPRLDFLKIDAEGAERDIWAGMQRTLDRSPAIQIVMEVNCLRYPDAAAFIGAVRERFQLQTIKGDGTLRPIRTEEVLAATDDVMLYLAADAGA